MCTKLRLGKGQVVPEAAKRGRGTGKGAFLQTGPGQESQRAEVSPLFQQEVVCLAWVWGAHQHCLWDSWFLSQTTALCSFGLQAAKPPGVTSDGSRTGRVCCRAFQLWYPQMCLWMMGVCTHKFSSGFW